MVWKTLTDHLEVVYGAVLALVIVVLLTHRLAERMLRAGVRFAMREEVLCDAYASDRARKALERGRCVRRLRVSAGRFRPGRALL